MAKDKDFLNLYDDDINDESSSIESYQDPPKTHKVYIIIGIILICVLIINFLGVQNSSVGVLPNNEDLPITYTISEGKLTHSNYNADDSNLNFKMAFFGIEVGLNRFMEGFKDLTHSEHEYRVMSSKQIASAYIRESLDGFELFIYDTIVVCSYSFIGIIGTVLLIYGVVSTHKQKNKGDYK